MKRNIELWDRFMKSGAPEDYLAYCRARAEISTDNADAASSPDPSLKGIPKLP